VAGRQGDCYILPILEVLASVAHDYKRDIYSRFLHLARDISLLLLIIYTYHSTSLNNRSFVACLCILFLLLWLQLVLACFSCFFCYCIIPTYAFTYCLLAWYPRDVLVGPFLLAEVRPRIVYNLKNHVKFDKLRWTPLKKFDKLRT